MKYLLISLIPLLLAGCNPRIVYVDRPVEVLVPQRCQATPPVKPKSQDNGAMNLDVIDKYINDLEDFVIACTKGK